MSDLICRKTMTRCHTPGMCAPFGGCQASVLVQTDVRYAADAQDEPAALFAVTAEAKRLQAECLALLSERDQLRAEVERLRGMLKEARPAVSSEVAKWQRIANVSGHKGGALVSDLLARIDAAMESAK